MPQLINRFSNGRFIEFDKGSFDEWCVFLSKRNGERFAPSDVFYFSRLNKLADIYGRRKIYDDFVVIYNRANSAINTTVLQLISLLSSEYRKNSLEMEIWFNVLYAGMVAEENKKKAVLKKRVKRLGMHQLLIDGASPEEAAGFSKGKKWKELDLIMLAKGF